MILIAVISTIAVISLFCNISQIIYCKSKARSRSYLTQRDELTGLLNRASFNRDLEEAVQVGKPFFLYMCDLDNFKQLNDLRGHKAGDMLLQKVSEMWDSLDRKAYVYRLGGDEFAIIYKGTSTQSRAYAEMLIQSMKKLSGQFSYITSSIGIAAFPGNADNGDDLLRYADSTMYVAKNSGKNRFTYCNEDLIRKVNETFEKELKVIECLNDASFRMMYQPQFDTKTKKLVGFEALLRIGSFDTEDAIKYIENNGLIEQLDNAVLEKVLVETKRLVQSYPELRISVNMSGEHVSSETFDTDIFRFLTEKQYPAKNLKIEITETKAIKDLKSSAIRIKRLRAYGVKISLDDFGVGYSSFKYLLDIKPDSVKLDKSFILQMKEDLRSVRFLINTAHELGCDVIAEGVESDEQLSHLRLMDCDEIQGFIWGEPMLIEDVENALADEVFVADLHA